MNFLSIKTTLESALNSWWPTVAGGGDPIAWENIPFNNNDSTYIVPEVVPAVADKMEYGRCGGVAVRGIFSIRLVGLVNIGAGALMTKADIINNHFSDTVFSTINTGTGRVQILGTSENRYQISVIIPFWVYQEAKS